MKNNILVIGSLNMDMVIGMKRMPVRGETVLGNSIKYVAGGKGANQAYAAGKLGGSVAIMGCVGNDTFGQQLRDNMIKAGVDVSALCILPDYSTGMAVIYVNQEGDNSIVVIPGANSACEINDSKIWEEVFSKYSYIMFQMEIPIESVWHGIRKAKKLEKTVILNPAPAPDNIPDDIFPLIDYFTPNETELSKITGITTITDESILQGADKLIKKGVKNVIVTLGEKGSLLVNKITCKKYPAYKAAAVDTTAAGDCFNGALAVCLSEKMDIDQAIIFANAASSIAVTRSGAQNSIPSRDEVDQKLRCKIT